VKDFSLLDCVVYGNIVVGIIYGVIIRPSDSLARHSSLHLLSFLSASMPSLAVDEVIRLLR
jgi:hypothetical protein